jgi:hypothetical protein
MRDPSGLMFEAANDGDRAAAGVGSSVDPLSFPTKDCNPNSECGASGGANRGTGKTGGTRKGGGSSNVGEARRAVELVVAEGEQLAPGIHLTRETWVKILRLHGPNSNAAGKSVFLDYPANILKMMRTTANVARPVQQGATDVVYEFRFSNSVGLDQTGALTRWVRVAVRQGKVTSSYPFKVP